MSLSMTLLFKYDEKVVFFTGQAHFLSQVQLISKSKMCCVSGKKDNDSNSLFSSVQLLCYSDITEPILHQEDHSRKITSSL